MPSTIQIHEGFMSPSFPRTALQRLSHNWLSAARRARNILRRPTTHLWPSFSTFQFPIRSRLFRSNLYHVHLHSSPCNFRYQYMISHHQKVAMFDKIHRDNLVLPTHHGCDGYSSLPSTLCPPQAAHGVEASPYSATATAAPEHAEYANRGHQQCGNGISRCDTHFTYPDGTQQRKVLRPAPAGPAR